MSDFFKSLEKTVVGIVTNVMGQTITYNLNPDDVSLNIKGVFNNEHIDVNGVNTTHPVLRINGNDLPRNPSIKDTVVIEELTYRVKEIHPDSFGGFKLLIKL